ncbi:transmembrane protein, putative [Bodo saltans]|uniref:Transmembrane protein, putative n=1 Tax=Bodo saltans TaxID=75058 RepID=A0A0S4IU68_BODSA|nr:transmembrane protein, putative [Bodo saltans]|eukprot:CUF23022.1 transmembrane protein, putative [Bodo saltans]
MRSIRKESSKRDLVIMSRQTNQISTSWKLFKLLLFTGLLVTLLGRSATATSTLVNISCYKTQTFNAADISNNTQLVVSGCDGRGQGSAFFATIILIQFSTTSSLLTNITILVQNSVSANVVIEGNAAAPTMIGLW